MKTIARIVILAFVALVSLYPVSMVSAQSATSPSSFKRMEVVRPDRSQGEISRQDEYFGGNLFRRIIQYRDGRMSTTEFHPNGVRKGEMIRDKDGIATIKLFQEDGEGLFRITVIEPGKVVISNYRQDGESVWYKQTLVESDRSTEYFDSAGRLRVQRHFEKTGFMEVNVFDVSGKLAYTQVWRPGDDGSTVSGYVLDHLIEPMADGKSRKINLDGSAVSGLEYLDKAGSLIRTESADSLGQPVERQMLREFAPGDDPTIPARQVPSTMIKR